MCVRARKVVKVDICGQQVSSYVNDAVWPLYSVVDPSIGHMLVADTDNHKILLLDSELRLQRVLLSGGGHVDGVDKPWRLSYEHRSGQLFVAMPHGKINVYRVR